MAPRNFGGETKVSKRRSHRRKNKKPDPETGFELIN